MRPRSGERAPRVQAGSAGDAPQEVQQGFIRSREGRLESGASLTPAYNQSISDQGGTGSKNTPTDLS